MSVTSFYEETKPLSAEEHVYAAFLQKLFETRRILEHNKISSTELCSIIVKKFNPKSFRETRLRKCMNYIRRNGLCPIASDNRGYFLAETPDQIEKCIKSLEDRIAGITIAKDGMELMLEKMKAESPQQKRNLF
jgi:hypothetical protein